MVINSYLVIEMWSLAIGQYDIYCNYMLTSTNVNLICSPVKYVAWARICCPSDILYLTPIEGEQMNDNTFNTCS